MQGSNLRERVKSVANAHWEMTTDLLKAFRLILDTAVEHKVPQGDMPETLFIFSDMQVCCSFAFSHEN